MRRRLTVLGFMAPWLVGFAAFVAYPMGASLYYSFTKYDILSPPRWVGLENYRSMLDDPSFWLAVRNTAWMVVVGVPIEVLFGIATALLLSRPRRGATAYRTALFLPSMAPAVAATLGFTYLLDPGVGPSTGRSARCTSPSRSGSTTRPTPSPGWCSSGCGGSGRR